RFVRSYAGGARNRPSARARSASRGAQPADLACRRAWLLTAGGLPHRRAVPGVPTARLPDDRDRGPPVRRRRLGPARGGRAMIRVVVALLTPYRSDGSVDADAVQAHVEWLLDQGVDGLMPAGTTGEGPLLEDDELVSLVRAV